MVEPQRLDFFDVRAGDFGFNSRAGRRTERHQSVKTDGGQFGSNCRHQAAVSNRDDESPTDANVSI